MRERKKERIVSRSILYIFYIIRIYFAPNDYRLVSGTIRLCELSNSLCDLFTFSFFFSTPKIIIPVIIFLFPFCGNFNLELRGTGNSRVLRCSFLPPPPFFIFIINIIIIIIIVIVIIVITIIVIIITITIIIIIIIIIIIV